MISLQELTDAWGSWFAKKNGIDCLWTESTNYLTNHGVLVDYNKRRVIPLPQTPRYIDNSPLIESNSVLYSQTYTNDTDTEQSSGFNRTEKSISTFTYGFQEALHIGVELSSKLSYPGIMDASIKGSIDLNFSATQTQTQTVENDFTVDFTIKCPPRKKINAAMSLSKHDFDLNFEYDVMLTGDVATWFHPKYTGFNGEHSLWFWPIGSVVQDCIDNNLCDTTGYSVPVRGGFPIMTAKGLWKGSCAINMEVITHQIN